MKAALARPFLAVVAAALLVAAGAARAEIIIGVAGPMSGGLAVLGAQMKAGAEQAVADANATGGINGETLRVEAVDDKCDAKTGDAVANQLAGVGAKMVAGHLCLSASIAAAPVYATNSIVQISPGTTFPKFTDERAGPGTFRVAGRDDQQAQVAAELLVGQFAGKKVAFVDDKSQYGKTLADAVRKLYNETGGREVLTQQIDPGQRDYSGLASVLAAAKIDVVYFGGYWTEAGAIVRDLAAAGSAAVLIGGDALANDDFGQIAGAAADGTLMTFMPDPAGEAINADLDQRLLAAGVAPEGYVLYTYAAVKVWIDAAKAAGSTDFAAVSAGIASGEFDTPLGHISFDAKGDVSVPGFAVYKWKGGTFAEIR